MKTSCLPLLLVMLMAPSGPCRAQNMRQLRTIRTPFSHASKDSLPRDQQIPVARQSMDQVTRNLTEAWNNRQLAENLSERFQQSTRLQESLQLRVPRDARLQVEAVRNVYTLDQKIQTVDGKRERVSTVTATLSTRILSNDPTNGFTAIPGTTEVVLQVYEEID